MSYNNCGYFQYFILVGPCIVVLLSTRNIICLTRYLQYILRMNQLPSKGSSSTLSIKQQGNQKIIEPLESSIVILGPEGGDKSSVFDWALNQSIAKKEVNVVAQETTAPRSLLPRVCRHFQPNLSLVELVKFQQNRNFIDETIASYFQKQVFEKTRKVKFVIVMSQGMLYDQARVYAGLIWSLQVFLSMFNFKNFSEEAKNGLKKSLSIVITGSHVASNNIQLLSDILKLVQQKYFKVENKQLIVQFLGELVNSGRIQPFLKSKDSKQPSECKFFQKFNQRKWQFFELGAQKLITKVYANEEEAKYQYYHTQQQNLYLMSSHFKWNYNKLTQSQKDSFNAYLDTKVYSFIQFYKILEVLHENLIENWQTFRKEWMQDNSVQFTQYKMKELFETIRSFIEQNDVFKTGEIVNAQQKIKYQPPNIIKALNSVFECQKLLQKCNYHGFSFSIIKRNVMDPSTKGYKQVQIQIQPYFERCMEIYSEYFPQMIANLKIFVTSHNEEILLERTICILKLSFWKYNHLYQIDRQRICDIKVKLLHQCDPVYQNPSFLPWRLYFSERFIKSIDNNLLNNLFPNMETLQEYESFIKQQYNSRLKIDQQYSKKQMDHFDLFYNENMCQIEMAKADDLCRLNKKEQALVCLLRGYQHVTFLLNYWSEQYDDNEENIQRQHDTMSTLKQNVIIKMVGLLTTLDSQNNIYRVYALQLSKHINLIKETCVLYRLLIETASGNKKIRLYREYADYCLQWGRLEEATVALQDRLSMGRELLEDYEATLKKLKDIRRNKEKFLQTYDKNLNKLGERLRIKDQKMDQIVLDIQKHSTELIAIKDKKKKECEELSKEQICMEQVQPSMYIISEGKRGIDADQSMYLISQ